MPIATIPEPVRRSGCPGCGKPAATPHTPFCSQGCKDRDLLQWLSDGYRIPGPPVDPERVDSSEGDG